MAKGLEMRRSSLDASSLMGKVWFGFSVAFVVSESHRFSTTNYRILRTTGTTTGNYVRA